MDESYAIGNNQCSDKVVLCVKTIVTSQLGESAHLCPLPVVSTEGVVVPRHTRRRGLRSGIARVVRVRGVRWCILRSQSGSGSRSGSRSRDMCDNCTFTHILALLASIFTHARSRIHSNARTHAHTHTCTHIYTHRHTDTHAHMHTRAHTHVRARTHTDTHTRTHAHTRREDGSCTRHMASFSRILEKTYTHGHKRTCTLPS